MKLLNLTFFISDFLDKRLTILPLKITGSIKNAKTIANASDSNTNLENP